MLRIGASTAPVHAEHGFAMTGEVKQGIAQTPEDDA
jgi:hypothetical protein